MKRPAAGVHRTAVGALRAKHTASGWSTLVPALALALAVWLPPGATTLAQTPAQAAPTRPASAQAASAPQRAPAFPRATAPPLTAAQRRLPGMSWESLQSLPAFIGSQWVPEATPADERSWLKQLRYPPLKPVWLARAQAAVQAIVDGRRPAPSTTCVLDGMPRAAWYPYPVQFLYAAGHVMLQQHDVIRAARVSGLAHPATLRDHNRLQSFEVYGDEAGVWQGDTLVIDTIGTRTTIDTFYGVPHDPDLHVVERYRLLPDGRLERRTAITAPAYFTTTWNIRTLYTRRPEASWATHFCLKPVPGLVP